MVWITIGCVLVVLLATLLLTPVRGRFSYDQGELSAWVRYGPVKYQIYPFKEAEKVSKQTAPPKTSDKGQDREKPEKKKTGIKINWEQIRYSLETLPMVLGRALRRTRRRIRLEPLKVHILVALPDPADTAVLFGKLTAALAAGLPALHRLMRIQEQDIRLFPDFTEERMDCIADVGISIRPWDLLVIAACAGGSLIKWFLRFRKLASPAPPEQPADEGNTTTEAA